MTNSYYNYSDSLTPGTRARADVVKTEFEAVEAAFDSIPADLDDIAQGANTVGTESGSGNAFVVTMPTTRTAHNDADEVIFKATHANTGASTLQVDSLSPVALRRSDGTALLGGDIASGRFYAWRYDSTNSYYVCTYPPLGSTGGSVDFDTPSGGVGLTATAGTGTTAIRSTAQLALSQSIAPTWTGIHIFNNLVKLADGTVGAPELTFTDDTDLGFYRIGANLLGITAGGVLVFSVGASATTFYTALTAGAGGAINMADRSLTRALIGDCADKVTAVTITGGVLTLDYENGPYFTVTNNANITTFAVQNWPASGVGTVCLILTANGTAYTQAWGSAVKWANGITPTITTTNGKRDWIVLSSTDGGTTIDASRVRANVG